MVDLCICFFNYISFDVMYFEALFEVHIQLEILHLLDELTFIVM